MLKSKTNLKETHSGEMALGLLQSDDVNQFNKKLSDHRILKLDENGA